MKKSQSPSKAAPTITPVDSTANMLCEALALTTHKIAEQQAGVMLASAGNDAQKVMSVTLADMKKQYREQQAGQELLRGQYKQRIAESDKTIQAHIDTMYRIGKAAAPAAVQTALAALQVFYTKARVTSGLHDLYAGKKDEGDSRCGISISWNLVLPTESDSGYRTEVTLSAIPRTDIKSAELVDLLAENARLQAALGTVERNLHALMRAVSRLAETRDDMQAELDRRDLSSTERGADALERLAAYVKPLELELVGVLEG